MVDEIIKDKETKVTKDFAVDSGKTKTAVLKFPYEVILKKHPNKKEALSVILDKDKSYTIAEVDAKLKAFYAKEIK